MQGKIGEYYLPSGEAPPGGVALALVCGGLAGIPLGLIYGVLCFYNPLIYITFIATIIAGVCGGMACTYGIRVGKVRNGKAALLAGLLSGIFAYYLAWAGYLLVAKQPLDFEVFLPWVMAKEISLLYTRGASWSIFGVGFGGFAWALCWLGEFVVITFLYAILPYSQVTEEPFCENCEDWTVEETEVATLEKTDSEMLKAALEAKEFAVLTLLPPTSPDNPDCLHLELHVCPECQENCYLSIDEITVKVDAKGESNTDTTTIVNNLCIPAEVVEEVRQIMDGDTEDAADNRDNDDEDENDAPDEMEAESSRAPDLGEG